jgi:hypothetical protein
MMGLVRLVESMEDNINSDENFGVMKRPFGVSNRGTEEDIETDMK